VGGAGRDLFADVALLQPSPPSASACLDAAGRCIVRDGLASTSVPDVARELGVSRGTVYRQVGPMPVIVRQLLRREVGRVLAKATVPPDELDADGLIRLMAGIVTGVASNPVLHRVLTTELRTMGVGFLENLPNNVRMMSGQLAPALASAMDAGRLARRDPEVLAEWLVRQCFSLAVAPTAHPPEVFFGEVLRPLLRP
jgi:TetR/AcrR family transcriptional regulator